MTQMAADDRHGIRANLRHLRLTQETVHQARRARDCSRLFFNHLSECTFILTPNCS